MTCKDCLHYSVCQYRRGREMLPTGNQCKDFTDRSERVHLPCKAGDKLYKVVPDFEKQRGDLKIQEYTVSGIGITVFVSNPYNAFYVDRIDGDVFLTREEAEKALEGTKEDG